MTAAPTAVAQAHRYVGTTPTAKGYVGRCTCGWSSGERRTRRIAQGAVAGHIGKAS